MNFKTFSSRSSLTQNFVESCVDFEVAHLSVLMVRRLAYPEIPTLSRSVADLGFLKGGFMFRRITGNSTDCFIMAGEYVYMQRL